MVIFMGMPMKLPCQEPARVLSFSNAFCASDCGPDVFGIGICICCDNATAAVATRMIRIVSFRIGSPLEWFVELQRSTAILKRKLGVEGKVFVKLPPFC